VLGAVRGVRGEQACGRGSTAGRGKWFLFGTVSGQDQQCDRILLYSARGHDVQTATCCFVEINTDPATPRSLLEQFNAANNNFPKTLTAVQLVKIFTIPYEAREFITAPKTACKSCELRRYANYSQVPSTQTSTWPKFQRSAVTGRPLLRHLCTAGSLVSTSQDIYCQNLIR